MNTEKTTVVLKVRFSFNRDGEVGLGVAHRKLQAKCLPYLNAGWVSTTISPMAAACQIDRGHIGVTLESPVVIAARAAHAAARAESLAPFMAEAGGDLPEHSKSRRMKLAKAAVALILSGRVARDNAVAIELINDAPSYGANENRTVLLAKIS